MELSDTTRVRNELLGQAFFETVSRGYLKLAMTSDIAVCIAGVQYVAANQTRGVFIGDRLDLGLRTDECPISPARH